MTTPKISNDQWPSQYQKVKVRSSITDAHFTTCAADDDSIESALHILATSYEEGCVYDLIFYSNLDSVEVEDDSGQ